ncbi:Alpha/Beta hydrolase protein [Suillus ampliporus]|nr:Alpha/Beta hydrolase protein [Suillus ampliporus]
MPFKANILALSQVFFVLTSLPPPAVATSAPIINLGYSQYQGSVDTATNITSFLGIRYAAPPVGDLRWAAPQPPSTISEVQQATTQPNECYQALAGTSSTNPFESTSMSKRAVIQTEDSEDCLFLNVFTPASEVVAIPPGGLPVVVWIHGGGYIEGNASLFNGADLIIESNHAVIAVIIQYRLGLFGMSSRCFGFLNAYAADQDSFLEKRSKKGGALNVGLLDQNYALQWVQAYISSFGGDPAKVTIWGESAGAGSVLQHLIAHGGNTQPPLFRSAMTSSAVLPSQYNYNDRIPEMLYSEVVGGTKRQYTAKREREHQPRAFFGTIVFVPVVDGTFIVERPTVTISKGRLNGNHLLAVTNSHEGNVFVNQSMTLDIADYVKTLFPNFGSAQAAGAVMMYQNQGSNVDQAILAIGESIFVCPTYYLVKAFGEQGWKGEFAIPPGLHGNDVLYYFPSLSYYFGSAYNNSQFTTAFSNSFMAMVMHETPDDRYTPGDITPSWTSSRNDSAEMMFNETSAGVPDVYPFKTDIAVLERCAYWLNASAYSAQ